jgi:hypothetical protein
MSKSVQKVSFEFSELNFEVISLLNELNVLSR